MNFLSAGNLEEFVESNRDHDEALWVLHHLPKTAGTALANELARHLAPNWTIDAYTQPRTLTYEQAIDLAFGQFARRAISTAYRFVAGHLERHHVQWFRGNERARIFTFLRDPLTRTISEYRYQQTPESPGSEQFIARFPSFDQYLRESSRRNPMTRALSGGIDVKACVSILETEYLMCGITEQFDDCADVLFRMMKIPTTTVARANSTPSTVPNEVHNPEAYGSLVRALNKSDVELYDVVRDRVYTLLSTGTTSVSSQPLQGRTDTEEDRYPQLFAATLAIARRSKATADVLSFGCSDGSETITLATRYFKEEGDRIIGVDIDQAALATARIHRAHPRVRYLSSSDQNGAGAGLFDVIFAMSVLCEWPDTRFASSATPIFSFSQFEAIAESLAASIRPGGVLCIYNANYRFTDTAIAAAFDAVRLPEVRESGFVKKFDRSGRPLANQSYDLCLFIKRAGPGANQSPPTALP